MASAFGHRYPASLQAFQALEPRQQVVHFVRARAVATKQNANAQAISDDSKLTRDHTIVMVVSVQSRYAHSQDSQHIF